MKNYPNKQLLFTILLCSLSTVAFGLSSCVDRTLVEIPTKKPIQHGIGRAPNPNPTPASTTKPIQHGSGRAPNPNPIPASTKKPIQHGSGRAPTPASF